MRTIWLDMDGTIIDLYADPNWLKRIEDEDVSLYEEAKPLINIKDFKKCCKKLQDKGYKIGIISYLPWEASKKYKKAVKKAKENYLKNYFSDITFDEVHIEDYTVPKHSLASKGDCIFDDDIKNRKDWDKGRAFTEKNIIEKLKKLYLK